MLRIQKDILTLSLGIGKYKHPIFTIPPIREAGLATPVRPIIYYVYDLESYIYETRSFYIDYEKKIAGPFARNEQELLALILGSDTWFYAEPYRSEFVGSRREFQKFSDGLATKRLLRYMRLRSSGYGVTKAAETAEASAAVELLEAN
jgi:hypothetical protein